MNLQSSGYLVNDLDERQFLSSQSTFRRADRYNKTTNNMRSKKCTSRISDHFGKEQHRLAVVSFSVLYIQKSNIRVKNEVRHIQNIKEMEPEYPKVIKNNIHNAEITLPPDLMPNKFKNEAEIAIDNKKHPPSTKPIKKKSQRPIAGVSFQLKQRASKWTKLKNQDLSTSSALADDQRQYYQQKYNISAYEELPFCIVIPSYNNVNQSRHLKNIKSVIMQEYKNYHIVFIDDASTDGTGEDVERFLVDNQTRLRSEQYTVIRNKQQLRAMPNLRMAAKEYCKPEQIFIVVDGDDQLLGRQVLKLFNAVFQKEKVWFIYSNFLSTRNTIGYSRPFPEKTILLNKYRAYPFVTSHLRAFYTQLFLKIDQNDLKDKQGHYLKAANDVAICIPILQMSHKRIKYIPELTYVYNSNTGQNNHKIRFQEQKSNNRMLRFRKKYEALDQLFPSVPQQTESPSKVENGQPKSHQRLLNLALPRQILQN